MTSGDGSSKIQIDAFLGWVEVFGARRQVAFEPPDPGAPAGPTNTSVLVVRGLSIEQARQALGLLSGAQAPAAAQAAPGAAAAPPATLLVAPARSARRTRAAADAGAAPTGPAQPVAAPSADPLDDELEEVADDDGENFGVGPVPVVTPVMATSKKFGETLRALHAQGAFDDDGVAAAEWLVANKAKLPAMQVAESEAASKGALGPRCVNAWKQIIGAKK